MHQEATILITKSFGDKVFFSRLFESPDATQKLSNPGLGLIIITTGLWWHGGVGKTRFQQSGTAHSGTGEKETLNNKFCRKIIKSVFTNTGN